MSTQAVPPPPSSSSSTDKNAQFLAATWSTSISALLIVTARIYVRIAISRRSGWDDWLIAVALVLSLTTASIGSLSISKGFAGNLSSMTPALAAQATELSYIALVPNVVGTAVAKVSVCLTLLSVVASKSGVGHQRTLSTSGHQRVSSTAEASASSSGASGKTGPSPVAKVFLVGLIVLLSLYQSIFIIFLFAQCRPVEGLWDMRLAAGCNDRSVEQKMALGSAILNVLVDLILTIFPVVLMWRCKMTKGGRVAVAFIASTGLFAMACGIIHAIDMNTLGSPAESLYSTTDLALWSVLEQNLTIIAACIFSLRVLFKPLFAPPPPPPPPAMQKKPSTAGEFYNPKINVSSETQVQPVTPSPPRAAQSNAPPVPTTPTRTPTRIPRIVVGDDPDSIDARLARLSESLASLTPPTSARNSPRHSPMQSPLSLFPTIRRVDSRPRVNSEGINNVYVYAPKQIEVRRKPLGSEASRPSIGRIGTEPTRSSNLAPPRTGQGLSRQRVQGPRNMGLSDRRGVARPFEVNVPKPRDVDRRIRDVNVQIGGGGA